jgi:hypothetical protein
VDFCIRAIPEIPPRPPFLKGGWGDFGESLPKENFLYNIQRVCRLVVQINTDIATKGYIDNPDKHGFKAVSGFRS